MKIFELNEMEKVVKRASFRLRYLFLGQCGLRPALGIALFLVVTILISYLLISMLPYEPSRGHYLSLTTHISNDGALLAAVLSGTVIMAMIERRSVWSYGLGDQRFWRHFLGGASIGLLLASLVIGCLVAVGRLGIDGLLLHGRDVVIYGAAWLAVFVVVALAEETLFRGYLQTTLARLIGFWPAAVLLSLAFGLVHLGNTGEKDLLGIVDVVVFGLVLS